MCDFKSDSHLLHEIDDRQKLKEKKIQITEMDMLLSNIDQYQDFQICTLKCIFRLFMSKIENKREQNINN